MSEISGIKRMSPSGQVRLGDFVPILMQFARGPMHFERERAAKLSCGLVRLAEGRHLLEPALHDLLLLLVAKRCRKSAQTQHAHPSYLRHHTIGEHGLLKALE